MLRRGSPGPPATGRRGAVAVLVGLSMVLLVGVLALVIDGGMMLVERRQAQAGADAAALAGVHALHAAGGNSSSARTAARAFAGANGYPDGGSTTVTVNTPPQSGRFAGEEGHVEVIVTHHRPRLFSGIWGSEGLGVTARAVARGRPDSPESSASLILLDPSRSGSLSLHGSGRIVTDAGIQVNSNHRTAVIAMNTGHTRPATPGKPDTPVVKVVGGFTKDASGYFMGPVVTGASPLADPLDHLPVPPQSGTVFNGLPFPQWGVRTMQPGVYNGGVNLGGGMTITMEPGIYYMKGGDFTVANGVRLTGHGVMIYVDAGGGRINFQGGGVITLTPPTSGPFAEEGITLYQDRNSTRDIDIANGSTTSISGTIYAAGARVKFAGGAQYNQYGNRFVAKSLEITNNAYVGVGGDGDYEPGKTTFNLVE